MEDRPQPTPPEPMPGCSSGATATLLVFTLGARRESRRRRLLPPAEKALEDRLHQACLDAALAAGRAAGFRLEVSSPLELALPADVARRPQRGSDFGSRLQSALERTFAEQGGPVVLVGSDVPELEASHLRRTREALEHNPESVVIGPSPDGGFYLLAASQPLAAALSEVRWRCRQTLRSLKQALRREGREIVLLSPLADLDRRADLEVWLAHAPRRDGLWRGLISRLSEVLAGLRRAWLPDSPSRPSCRELRAHRLRGPPIAA